MLFNKDNIGNEIKPYSYPDINEDLKYISTFVKGRNNTNDIRILMSGVNTGDKYFMFLKEDFSGNFLHFIDLKQFKTINHEHYKFKSYNYYFLRNDTNDVNIILNEWIKNNPLPFQYSSFKIDLIDNYTYLFNYNGNKY
ncbi:MAG TPA: hypothetical protein PKG93_03010 [Bacilli bacterium]|nr:hypothetical protein [Bacilli bacterium]